MCVNPQPAPDADPQPQPGQPAAPAHIPSEPFHPQCRIFSMEKLMRRFARLYQAGDSVASTELKNAIEAALPCGKLLAIPTIKLGGGM